MSKHGADWGVAQDIRTALISDGWSTPDTYCGSYQEIIDGPAVYLFLLYRTEHPHTYKRALVAYVGMSTRLRERLRSHNILPQLQRPGLWPMRWFKPVEREELRTTEREYISRFAPPWNIIGRSRGVDIP